MLKHLLVFSAAVAAVLLTGCSPNDPESHSSSSIGGSTTIPMNTVGNTFTATPSLDGSYTQTSSSIQIIASSNGVNTFQVSADLSAIPAINNVIPAELKDAQGRVNFQTNVKMTSEGVLDYSNTDEAPLVAVRYDAKVGDQYVLTKSDGTKIVRTVTARSTTDDYPWGMYNIKVIKVEQPTTVPGISKYVGYFNHRFGFVAFEIHAEDGSVFKSNLYSQYENQ